MRRAPRGRRRGFARGTSPARTADPRPASDREFEVVASSLGSGALGDIGTYGESTAEENFRGQAVSGQSLRGPRTAANIAQFRRPQPATASGGPRTALRGLPQGCYWSRLSTIRGEMNCGIVNLIRSPN